MPDFAFDLLRVLNRWPRRLAVVACLLLAGASALAQHHPAAAAGVPSTSVVVASRAIPAGTTLARADLRVVHWPRPLVPTGTTPDPTTLTGRRVAAAVAPGEAVTVTRLVGADLASGLAAGQVAVPVPIADATAAALIRVGDSIDLLAGPADGVSAAATSSGRPVATGVRVLAVLPSAAGPGASPEIELIIATDRATALRVATLIGRPLLAVRDDDP